MNIKDTLIDTSAILIVFLIIFILLLPLISSIVIGMTLATLIGLTGLSWWCFLYLFVVLVMGIIGFIYRKDNYQ